MNLATLHALKVTNARRHRILSCCYEIGTPGNFLDDVALQGSSYGSLKSERSVYLIGVISNSGRFDRPLEVYICSFVRSILRGYTVLPRERPILNTLSN